MKYFPLSLTSSSVSQIMLDDYKYAGHTTFKDSTDIFVIAKETSFGSNVFEDVDARLTSVINVSTGTKMSDDWRQLIFDPTGTFMPTIGYLFYFSENFWLSVFTDNTKSVLTNVVVRRCNNVLRWMSISGSEIYSEPCAIEYEISGTDNDVSSDNIVTPNGTIKVYVQQNSKTNTITENRRFLLGNSTNWVGYRVTGGGLRNFLNSKTYDNSSSQLMMFRMETGYTNDATDDLVNGIADRYLYLTSGSSSAVANIVISPSDGTILEGDSQTFDTRYYSGSTVLSGSFIFSVSGSMVPNSYYAFSTLSPNTFSVTNNTMYLDYPLNILCSGSSGSRIFEISLAGGW